MTTRKITFHLSLALLMCVGVVHAGEFSMSSGGLLAQVSAPVEVDRGAAIEPSSSISSSADNSSRFMRGAGVEATPGTDVGVTAGPALEGASATPSTTARMDSAPVATVAPNRARTGNRWQSLVPGAIK